MKRQRARGRSEKASLRDRPLWQCPKCGHELAGRNMWHSCEVHDVDEHFRGKPPEVRALFDALVRAIREVGPFKIEAQKTRIVFQVRVRFAGAFPLRKAVRGHFWLTRPRPGPPVTRIEKFLETSIPSFYHEVRTDADMVARRQWTRRWWATAQDRTELVTSAPVLEELEAGDYASREDCIDLMATLPLLAVEPPVLDIVDAYISRHRFISPSPPSTAATSWSRGTAGTLPTRTGSAIFAA